jgi:hypothetical protein
MAGLNYYKSKQRTSLLDIKGVRILVEFSLLSIMLYGILAV